MQDYQVLFSW